MVSWLGPERIPGTYFDYGVSLEFTQEAVDDSEALDLARRQEERIGRLIRQEFDRRCVALIERENEKRLRIKLASEALDRFKEEAGKLPVYDWRVEPWIMGRYWL